MLDVKLKAEALNEDEIVVHLQGNLVISNAENIISQLSSAISGYDRVTIKGSEITEIDLSIIQLLKAFQADHSLFIVEFSFNEDLQELMNHSGFHYLLNN